jgi:hypothetical protein
MTTRAIPHQRRVEISSPRNTQQLNGTRISTTRERGKAIVSGMYLRTYSQLTKLATIRMMAHHTSGETKPLIPVHDQAL